LNNPSIHLRIAGSGAFEADLRRQVSRNQMGNQVTFAGLVAHENLPSEYRGADIFVLPSRGDSFGQVFTEAMACGLPIIACRARATPEVVADGKGGQLVEPGDVPALAAAIQNLSTNVAARRDMSAFNRQLAVDAFSWHSVASRYTEIYQSVLA
jgi:glycosyltransferase involved in cell wall biosynthesis